ncbi:hypothetical protein LXA43DRAFT_541893 [Ganoderma leucocontextum]|nr:hypothetical protein LXA43DRAFT_541893 [Ganoderma leucocontextum]
MLLDVLVLYQVVAAVGTPTQLFAGTRSEALNCNGVVRPNLLWQHPVTNVMSRKRIPHAFSICSIRPCPGRSGRGRQAWHLHNLAQESDALRRPNVYSSMRHFHFTLQQVRKRIEQVPFFLHCSKT